MNYIANVVITDGSKINYDKSVRRCTDISEADSTLPTLIIGYHNAEKWINNYNILKKWYPEQNLFWTFGKRERKYEYDDDIEAFYKLVVDTICKDIKYSYLNIINTKYSNIKELLSFLYNEERKVIYIENNRFLFIYEKNRKRIIGISLDLCQYIGIPKDKVLTKLKKNSNIKIINSISFLNRKLREFVYNNKHYVPVFYDYFNY